MILKRITDTETAETVRVVNTVLKWILCTLGFCRAELVSEVPPLGEADTDRYRWKHPAILDICQNLVVYDEQLNTFRFAHFSVQEFLIDQPECDEEETHTGIAETCLTVLMRQPDTTDSELLYYSTDSWAVHVRLSGGGNRVLEGLWKEFLQPLPAYRVEVGERTPTRSGCRTTRLSLHCGWRVTIDCTPFSNSFWAMA